MIRLKQFTEYPCPFNGLVNYLGGEVSRFSRKIHMYTSMDSIKNCIHGNITLAYGNSVLEVTHPSWSMYENMRDEDGKAMDPATADPRDAATYQLMFFDAHGKAVFNLGLFPDDPQARKLAASTFTLSEFLLRERVELLHPSLMYRLLRYYWFDKAGIGLLTRHTDYRPPT